MADARQLQVGQGIVLAWPKLQLGVGHGAC